MLQKYLYALDSGFQNEYQQKLLANQVNENIMNPSEETNEPKGSDQEPRTGVIPNEQISGSDADKAYDEDGNFVKTKPTGDSDAKTTDSPPGSDSSST